MMGSAESSESGGGWGGQDSVEGQGSQFGFENVEFVALSGSATLRLRPPLGPGAAQAGGPCTWDGVLVVLELQWVALGIPVVAQSLSRFLCLLVPGGSDWLCQSFLGDKQGPDHRLCSHFS